MPAKRVSVVVTRRLPEVVEWVAGQLKYDGLADIDGNSVRFINLAKDVTAAR